MSKRAVHIVALVSFVMAGSPASAFGLKTHLWIGQKIIDDLEPDCRLEIAGEQQKIDPDLCASILGNRGAFLAGVIGPDGFPDLITGQITTHPGLPGGWQTSDWLKHVYAHAPTGDRLAFSAGFVVHAGSDTFAHSYVNAYSGDIFEIGDERAVELRHFVLEKYIDAHLPSGVPDVGQLKVPAEYLRERLIYNDDAARASAMAKALHIPAMFAVRKSVGELTRELDKIEERAANVAADVLVENGEFQLKLASGETALKGAEVALAANQASLDAQRQLLDTAKGTFDDALDRLKKNDVLIKQSELTAKAARAAINNAENIARAANNRLGDIEREVNNLQSKLASTPAQVTDQVCETVEKKVCKNLPWPASELCKLVKETSCRPVQIANGVYGKIQRELSQARDRLADAKQDITNSGITIAAETAREANALQQKAQAEAAKTGLNVAREAAQVAYDLEKAKYDALADANKAAKQAAEDIRKEIKRIRTRLADLDSIREEIARLISQSNLLSFYSRNWEKGLDKAGDAYIIAGLDTAKQLATLQGGVFDIYKRWLTCYGGAYTPVPYQFGEYGCAVDDSFKKVDAEVKGFVIRNLPAPFDDLYKRYFDIRTLVEKRISNELENAAIQLAKLAAPDASTSEFIEVLVRPENANVSKLREVFAQVGDSKGKALLTFPDITKQVDSDLALADGKITPARFYALDYALRLSKLALLNNAQLRRFVWKMGGDPADVPGPVSDGRDSLLFRSLRSIDGNQQWQPFGIPYARSTGTPEPQDAAKRRYGWGPADADGGMPLFVTARLRNTVFASVFPKPITGALAQRPEMQYPAFRFPSCNARAFPVTFNADGTPADGDPRCTQPGSDRTPGENLGNAFERFFRGIIGALGFGPKS